MFFILIVLTLLTAFYFFNLNYQYWKKRGVPGPKPTFLVGNLGPSFLLKKAPAQVYEDIYNEYKNYPILGVYRTATPALMINDPEIIRDVTVKSFANFQDNDLPVDKDVDPLFGRNPFVLRGEEWKTVRTLLSPGFTSGKMKWVYPLLEEVSEKLVGFIEGRPEAASAGYEAKELCMRFALNNVASCVFGLEAKCFEENDNEFMQIAKGFFSPEAWHSIKLFIISIIPVVAKIMSIKFTSNDVEQKLTNIVTQTLKYREENKVVRNDYLHVLQQLKSTSKEYKFTELDVTAHAAGFFGDGYETSSIVMSFVLYELAANPEEQSILREEICKAFQENGNTIPYEALQGLQYLDGVINEAMRLHPPVGALQKVCTKPFTYTPEDGSVIKQPVHIEKGMSIIMPVYGLHRDPKYYENPNSFKPERFIGANKDKLTKYSYLPFGEGPRACLGQRFGILQIKVGVVYIIKNFKLSVNKKTRIPLKYDPLYFMTAVKDGLWLDFKKIA